MTIWLTGCTSGLGKALLSEFTEAGHTLVGCGRNEIELQKLGEEFRTHHFFSCDVTSDQQAAHFCAQALDATGPPDLLINNAAMINDPAPLWEISAEDFDLLIATNVSGVANLCRHALPPMIAQEKGIIVNLSSGWGRSVSPEVAPYCASKWAIEGLTKALAEELPTDLATVAVNPGIIATKMLQQCMGEAAADYPSAESWAVTAAPFLTAITTGQNGQSLTAP